MAGQAKTIVEYFAEHERYRCGYCGSKDTNYSHGMWAHAMTVQDYQDLLDRGWRRSGKYVYKPTMDRTCCPQYTIRCEVNNFKLRKSHKKVIKKVNKFLIHGIKPSSDNDVTDCGVKNEQQSQPTKSDTQTESNQPADEVSSDASQSNMSQKTTESKEKQKTVQPGTGADPSKPPCKKAKQLRKEKKMAKMAAAGASTAQQETGASMQSKSDGKSLEELLDEPNKAPKCAHKLEVRLIRSYPKSGEFKASLDESYTVYKRYQMTIHKDDASECDRSTYTNFLVESPLEEEKGSLPDGYGSFHQQYILDGKIICVGVIDILPNLVSSKYLYYDPDYQFLTLGTYSALREVAFVRELHRHSADMIYYYMGFYIHSCPKMTYKGQYQPSFLLCPETYTWHPVEKCAPMLDQKSFCRFADPSVEDEVGRVDLDNVLVLFMRQMMTYTIYKMLSKGKNSDEEEVREYAGFVGRKCYSKMLLFRK